MTDLSDAISQPFLESVEGPKEAQVDAERDRALGVPPPRLINIDLSDDDRTQRILVFDRPIRVPEAVHYLWEGARKADYYTDILPDPESAASGGRFTKFFFSGWNDVGTMRQDAQDWLKEHPANDQDIREQGGESGSAAASDTDQKQQNQYTPASFTQSPTIMIADTLTEQELANGRLAGLSTLESAEYLENVKNLSEMSRQQFERFSGLWLENMNALLQRAEEYTNRKLLEDFREGQRSGRPVELPSAMDYGNIVQDVAYGMIEAEAEMTGMQYVRRGQKWRTQYNEQVGIALERKPRGAAGGRIDIALYGGADARFSRDADIGHEGSKQRDLANRNYYATPRRVVATPEALMYERLYERSGFEDLMQRAAEIQTADRVAAAAGLLVDRLRKMSSEERQQIGEALAGAVQIGVNFGLSSAMRAEFERYVQDQVPRAAEAMAQSGKNQLIVVALERNQGEYQFDKARNSAVFSVDADGLIQAMQEFYDLHNRDFWRQPASTWSYTQWTDQFILVTTDGRVFSHAQEYLQFREEPKKYQQ
jgi:hypothetical protein